MVSSQPKPQPSDTEVHPLRRAAELLSKFDGFGEAVESVKNGTDSTPSVNPGTSLEQVEAMLRSGTDEERQAVAAIDPRLLSDSSGYYAQFDQRLDAIEREVPLVGRDSGFLGINWGKAADIAGNVLETTFDVLELPAEGVERTIGMFYWNEIPLADRWHMAAVTYDSIHTDLFSNGRSKQNAVFDYYAHGDLDKIEQDYENVWGDMIGHFMLDPLWLVGGIGAASKLAPVGPRGQAALARGVDFSRIPGVNKIPVLNRVGRPVKDDQLAQSLLRMAPHPEDYEIHRVTGGVRRALQLTPRGKVDSDIDNFLGVFGAANDPKLWDNGAAGMRQVIGDLASGTPRREYLGRFADSQPVRHTQAMLRQNPELGVKMSQLKSLDETINPADAFWASAREALKVERDGKVVNILDLMRDGVRLTPEESALYGSYRHGRFIDEWMTKTIPDLFTFHGAEVGSDMLQKVESLSAGMKGALSLTVLNNPRFVALNYLSNTFHLALKSGDFGAAVRYARNPTKFSRAEVELLTEIGLTPQTLQSAATDASFLLETLPQLAGATQGGKWHNLANKFGFFVKYADKLDQGGRTRSYVTGVKDAYHAVWKFGDGGVLDEIPEQLRSVPGFEDWVLSLAMKGFDSIDGALTAADTQALLSGRALASKIVKEQATQAGQSDLWQSILGKIPDAYLDELDDIVDGIKAGRVSGTEDYLSAGMRQLDQFADDLDLKAYRLYLSTHGTDVPIPMQTIRGSVPWQDVAHRERLAQVYQESLGRIAVANFSSTQGAAVYQQRLHRAIADYQRGVDEIYELMRNTDGAYPTQAMRSLVERLDAALPKNFIPRQVRETQEAIIESLLVGVTRRAETGSLVNAHRDEALAIGQKLADLGFEMPRATAAQEGINAARATIASIADQINIVNQVKQRLPQALNRASVWDEATLPAARQYMESMRESMRMRNSIGAIHGRTVRDWTMLNYSRRYGIDGVMQMVFPYHFWAGRMTRDWARMTLARPGATAALSRLYEGAAEMSDSADLPDRLKNNIRIPIPFLDNMVGGVAGTNVNASFYFDPIRILYPLSGLQNPTDFGPEESDLTSFGQSYSFVEQVSPFGVNPFMTLGLGATGMLGDRDEFVRRSLASVTQTPLGVPGPRLGRAISDFFMGIADPDSTVLSDEMKEQLAAGEPLEESVLREAWGEIWDYTSTDGFNDYRLNRTIAAMVAEDPNRWKPSDALRAIRDREGALYAEAKKRAGTEYGLAVLTGWLAMPVRMYPEGEKVQRGLDAIWRELIREGDSKGMDEFFTLHPEYQVRMAASSSGLEQLERIDTDLYYEDVAKVHEKYAQHIDQLRATLREAEETGYLQTKEGRRLVEFIETDLSYLYSLRQEEEEQVAALYPNRVVEMSLRAAPRERALHSLREQYTAIKPSQFSTSAEFYAAQEAFVERLASEANPELSLGLAIQSAAIWARASERMAAAPDKASAIAAERDTTLQALTSQAVREISADEFLRYLEEGRTPKTAARLEYNQASSEITEYYAIAEAPGLTPTDKKTLQRQYWDSHPLLEKYYGRDELGRLSPEQAAAIGQMDLIWDGYFAIELDARRQRDYLISNLNELNEYRAVLGLPKIQMVNWDRLQANAFVQQPTTPVETALQGNATLDGNSDLRR